jgi:hypothetical protein
MTLTDLIQSSQQPWGEYCRNRDSVAVGLTAIEPVWAELGQRLGSPGILHSTDDQHTGACPCATRTHYIKCQQAYYGATHWCLLVVLIMGVGGHHVLGSLESIPWSHSFPKALLSKQLPFLTFLCFCQFSYYLFYICSTENPD